jgi:D-serine deaminase-like pyridoxal phosphate-dependent protein
MTTALVERSIASRSWQSIPLDPPVPIDAVPTPALMLDEHALRRNIAKMSSHLAAHGKRARPHAKTHKCPLIARLQLDAGAVGICVAKVSEGWAMASAGIGPLLVTSPVSTADKAESVARLACISDGLAVAVDSERGIDALAAACRASRVAVAVLIDLDPLMGRTGVREPAHVYSLAERARAAGLRIAGVQHYAGHVMHVTGFEERRTKSLALWERAAGIWTELGARGFDMSTVSGGGTGTYDIDCDVAGISDLQVGSYIFMDRQYADIGGRAGAVFEDFETSLTVTATAISQPHPAAVTLDCGYKGMASDAGAPVVRELGGAQFRFGGDEHGIVVLPKGHQEPVLGRRFSLFVSHCDPTVNLYDHYWVHRDGVVHELWPITARGCSW